MKWFWCIWLLMLASIFMGCHSNKKVTEATTVNSTADYNRQQIATSEVFDSIKQSLSLFLEGIDLSITVPGTAPDTTIRDSVSRPVGGWIQAGALPRTYKLHIDRAQLGYAVSQGTHSTATVDDKLSVVTTSDSTHNVQSDVDTTVIAKPPTVWPLYIIIAIFFILFLFILWRKYIRK